MQSPSLTTISRKGRESIFGTNWSRAEKRSRGLMQQWKIMSRKLGCTHFYKYQLIKTQENISNTHLQISTEQKTGKYIKHTFTNTNWAKTRKIYQTHFLQISSVQKTGKYIKHTFTNTNWAKTRKKCFFYFFFCFGLITNKFSSGFARNDNDTSLRVAGWGWEGINKGEVIKASACPTRSQHTFHNQLFASLNRHISQQLTLSEVLRK